MKITIALPGFMTQPSGGFHVHYTYANMLHARGHDVTILFPRKVFGSISFPDWAKSPLWKLRRHIRHRPLVSSFNLSNGIKLKLVPDLTAKHIPDADALIATGWQTAEVLESMPERKGRKFYIVYDYEFYMTAEADIRERIGQTFTQKFHIIATSSAVRNMIEDNGGAVCDVISCGIDFNDFGVDTIPESRLRLSLGFPVRRDSFKGLNDAIDAANILKQKHGNLLKVTAFGTDRLHLPEWIEWLQYPSQQELRQFYNSQSVFLLPSHFEGWGLPAVEAMACGAALVTADNGGGRDYALHENTAMVAPCMRPDILANHIERLFNDDELRIRLAKSGNNYVQRFSWVSAADQLENLLKS